MRVHFFRLSSRQARRRARAFTLVELLVVIGVVAVLIAILLPVLGKARAQANRVACLSNIRQLGGAILMYCNDNEGYFPTCAYWESLSYVPYPEDWIHWQSNRRLEDSAIAKYVGRGEKLKALLRCPADNFDARKTSTAAYPGQGPYLYSYGMNDGAGVNGRGPFPAGRPERTKINQWRAPSRKILLTENAEDISTAGGWSQSRMTRRHGAGIARGSGTPGTPAGRTIGINVSAAFFDGHAESVDEDYARHPLFHRRPDLE
jgi:prepilin-type N-terminal cleavage/methylation domain-containing protein